MLSTTNVATPRAGEYPIVALDGVTRYDTSAQLAFSAFLSSEWAIVASGAGYAVSISAAGLAGALDRPIILADSNSVLRVTENALKKMGMKHVVLFGGTAVTSRDVGVSLQVPWVRWLPRARVRFESLRDSDERLPFVGKGALGGRYYRRGQRLGFADALSVSLVIQTQGAGVFRQRTRRIVCGRPKRPLRERHQIVFGHRW